MSWACVSVVDDLPGAAFAAFLEAVRSVTQRGRCMVALSGGSTPKALYERLGATDLPWDRIELFFGDERAVPLDDERSNYRMVKAALLDRIPVVAHPLTDPAGYEALLREKLGAAGAFDVLLLGMGEDGHTASLFPGSPALDEHVRWVVAAPGVAPAPERYTITPPVIVAAKQTLMLVGGAGKAHVLHEVLQGPPDIYPSQLAREGPGDLTWLVDRAAGASLVNY